MDNSLIVGAEKNEINVSDWVLLRVPGTGYLGKVAGIAMSKVAGSDKDDRIKDFKKKVYAAMKENDGWLELSAAYDYSAPLMPAQSPDGRRFFHREPVVVPVEFTTAAMPVSVRPSGILFLADLSKDDRATYETFIRGVEETVTRLRAQKAGLVTPQGQGIAHG